MADSIGNRDDGLWGRETRLPTLTPLNTDRLPPTAPAVTARQRVQQLAIQLQLRAAAARRSDAERTEDREADDRDHEPVSVRIRWEHMTRYEADLSVDPWVSEDDLLATLDSLPASQRRVIDIVDGDDRLVSVVDLDGDGHIDAYEISAGVFMDWGDVADSIDETIAESPAWPALNAVLVAAAAQHGYDVTNKLPRLAAEAPLPSHDPAGELYYRLLDSGAVDVDTGGKLSASSVAQPPPRRDEVPRCEAGAQHISAPAV